MELDPFNLYGVDCSRSAIHMKKAGRYNGQNCGYSNKNNEDIRSSVNTKGININSAIRKGKLNLVKSFMYLIDLGVLTKDSG